MVFLPGSIAGEPCFPYLDHNSKAGDGQDIKPAFPSIPEDANPEIIPGKERSNAKRFHGFILPQEPQCPRPEGAMLSVAPQSGQILKKTHSLRQ